MRRPAFLVAVVVLLAGCTLGPDYERPPTPDLPVYLMGPPSSESVANTPWWELFQDSVLTALIDTALVHNQDLGVAMGRIAEARATLGIVRADLFPRINYAADGSILWTSEDEDGGTAGAGAFVDASWQVDLWGRIRRSNEAALQELLATEEAYRGVTISLVAEVASSYLLLRDIDNRLIVSERTVESRRQTLELVQTRFEAGMVSEVDVNQAKIQLAQAEASVQVFKRLRGQTENGINVLLGRPPQPVDRGQTLQEQAFPPELPAGLPSELLERRPDVLEAERQLHAQTARIGVAEALKFPQLNLTGSGGADFAENLTTGIAGLGAQLFGPIFNSGENQRRIDAEVARTEQLLNRYEKAILTAYREVEDALIAVETYKVEYAARQRQVDAAQKATDLTWVRYEGGMTSFLEVQDIERSLFSSQLSASETQQLHLTSIVRLYQALGGGWVVEQDTLGVTRDLNPDTDE
jgi:multidrug efflux system outer membrane protein